MTEAHDETEQPPTARDRAAGEANAPVSGDRWRRIHALSGAALVALLALHVVTSASALGGEAAFERVVGALARSSLWPVIELFVLVPLALHAVSALRLLGRKGAPSSEIERYGGRPLWSAQRISGVLVLAFLLVHAWELRVARLAFGLSPDALHTTLVAKLSSTWAGIPHHAIFYLLGIGAAALHAANGLFAATAGWGALGRARRRLVSSLFGAALFVVGAATVIGLATGTRLFAGPEPAVAPCGPSEAAPPTSR